MSEVGTTSYELSVSFERENGDDAPIHRIADQFGFTHSHSGTGSYRDLGFERDNQPPTETELAELKKVLSEVGFPVEANIEAWRYDAAGEAIEDDQENETWAITDTL